jgi:serine/threonine protein kinase
MAQVARPPIGHYSLGERLERDGPGEVYRAYNRRLIGREVAIRLLPAELGADPRFVARFDRELGALASLTHPHILPILGRGEEGGRPSSSSSTLPGVRLPWATPWAWAWSSAAATGRR